MIDLYCCNRCRRVVAYLPDEKPDKCGAPSTAHSTSGVLGEFTVYCSGALHLVTSPEPFVPYKEPLTEEDRLEGFMDLIKTDLFGT